MNSKYSQILYQLKNMCERERMNLKKFVLQKQQQSNPSYSALKREFLDMKLYFIPGMTMVY